MNENNKTRDWMQKYELAQKYYNHYKNLDVPMHFKTTNGIDYDEKGIPLGRWINFQRQSYKSHTKTPLPEDKIELLNKIHMIWDSHEYEWNRKYELASIYINHYGTNRIPLKFTTLNGIDYDPNGIKLGLWLSVQRRILKGKEKNTLSQTQINLLNELGITRSSWMHYYTLARKYYETYGNLLVLYSFKTVDGINESPNGVKLGQWVRYERVLYTTNDKRLTESQRDLLKEIGIDVNVCDEKWMKYYRLAKIYYEHHGNLEVPNPFKTINGYEKDEKGINLGAWIGWHRQDYRQDKVSADRIELLNKIGMRFEVTPKDSKEVAWMKKYKLAKNFFDKYGTLEIPQNFITTNGIDFDPNGIKLGIWINMQRVNYKRKKLLPERYELLNKLGMRFTSKNPETWSKNYEMLCKYKEKFGTTEVPYKFRTLDGINPDPNGFTFGCWVECQRSLYRKGELSKDRVKKLSKLGFRFDKFDIDIEWMKKYELAKKYFENHGNLNVPYNFKTIDGYTSDPNGVELGAWITSMRQSFKGQHNNHLDYQRIYLLDQINMPWYKDEYNEKFQNEEITDKNKKIKQRELLNRFKSMLNEFDDNSLPSKREINNTFIRKLKK